MTDLDFINKFTSISVNKMCKEMGITLSNLKYGRNKGKEYIIRRMIEERIAELYKLDEKELKYINDNRRD